MGERTVAAINRVLASRSAHRELIREGRRWVSRERPVSTAPEHLLVPIAESAVWLLEHGDGADRMGWSETRRGSRAIDSPTTTSARPR